MMIISILNLYIDIIFKYNLSTFTIFFWYFIHLL